jgi:hypothetical protein
LFYLQLNLFLEMVFQKISGAKGWKTQEKQEHRKTQGNTHEKHRNAKWWTRKIIKLLWGGGGGWWWLVLVLVLVLVVVGGSVGWC